VLLMSQEVKDDVLVVRNSIKLAASALQTHPVEKTW
jgi:hypothetical protein